MTPEALATGLTTYIVLLFSLSVHEAAHAWTASRMGDETARQEGRITLNPLAHIDPVGTVVIPLLQIFVGGIPFLGWAKPTPVQPRNFRPGLLERGHVFVSGAGPLSNLLLALLFTAALFVGLRLGAAESRPALALLTIGLQMNVGLALLNMLPLPPLDGATVASWTLPREIAIRYDRFAGQYGPWILFALVLSGGLGIILSPLMRSIVRFLYSLAR
jgi:Zn-dependent protease